MTDVFFWPMISLISIGLMAKFIKLGPQTLGFVMTGTLAAGVLQITQLDVGYTVLYELWSKSLKHTLLTPVGVSEGVAGTWIIGMVRGFIAFVLLSLCRRMGFWFSSAGASYHGIIFIWAFCLCFYFGHSGQYPYFVLRSKSRDHRLDVCPIIHDHLRHLLSGGYSAQGFSIHGFNGAYYAFSGIFPPVLRL